ncbi:hypothetical protein [Gramella sp. KN1008]|uniref:hypothetical protein n=1 Tax=Gramella sp. KN1008 TaxID=2529298 RepID=UPI00103B1BCE|nr:hypothetical protein [Gramella sp. KN1008]TBW26750.1 hypothetical protein EZJ28_12965 [Gramella sp. KN1008]
MKYSRIFILACLPLIVVNLTAEIYELEWLATTAEILIYCLLLIGFYRRLEFYNLNISGFFSFSLLATTMFYFHEQRLIFFFAVFINMISYFFLMREALRYTQREAANKFMLLFFFVLIAVNIYFLFQHLQQLEIHITGMLEFGFYSVYYINLIVLGIVALIYYLNSFSRKSVFFISMVLSLIVADVLRDMAAFYLRDPSVIFIENVLRFASVILAFEFFATEEKKLRLINLV